GPGGGRGRRLRCCFFDLRDHVCARPCRYGPRVRPGDPTGGRIALANWAAHGGVGRMFEMMAPYQPAPVSGVGSPFAWGDESHVEELLGEAFELRFEHHVSTYRVSSGEEYWQVFSSSYGPTKTLAESLDRDRREQLHQ